MSREPEQPAAGDGARDEAARQAVALVFGVASALLMIAAQRAAGDPDFYRTVRMRAWKAAERSAARAAGTFWRAAERARRLYEREAA